MVKRRAYFLKDNFSCCNKQFCDKGLLGLGSEWSQLSLLSPPEMIRKFQGTKELAGGRRVAQRAVFCFHQIRDHFYYNRRVYSDIFLLIKDLPLRINLVSRKERKSNHIKQVV